MLQKKVNDGQNMKTAEPNKYPLVYAPEPLSLPLISDGLVLLAFLAETSSVPGLPLISGGLGLSLSQAKTTITALGSMVTRNRRRSRMLSTSIRAILTPTPPPPS